MLMDDFKSRRWAPYSIEDFINDYLSGLTTDQLAAKYKGSSDQVKRFIAYLRKAKGLPPRKSIKEGPVEFSKFSGINIESLAREFLSYLKVSRTISNLRKRYEPEILDLLLSYDYPGYSLFNQVNDYGEPCYILLPDISEDLNIKPRNWKYYNSYIEDYDSEPVPQAYHLVQLPDEVFEHTEEGRVDIIPLYDVHYGHYGHKFKKFLSYVRYIEETPNVYTFLGGDIMENALDDGRGLSYDQQKPPQTQLNEITRILAPVAHKCLFAIPGNHEWRTHKKSGVEPMFVLAKRLDIPYFDGPVYCSILGKGHKWKLYAFHGKTGSQTKGGKLNSAGRPRRYTDFINWFVSGHVHEPVLDNETCIVEDPVNCRLVYKTQWTVVCPSFLRYEGTYAYREGYPPPGKGGVTLSMYASGDYIARLTEH